jgi:Glycosyltransferase
MIGPYPQDPNRVERGVEAVTVNLVEGLKRIENLNMQIISCTQSVRKEKSCDIGGVKVHFLPSARRFGNITLGAIDRLTVRRKIKELSPDIVHNQYHFAYPYLFSKPDVPAITTVHGITFKEAPYENENFDWLRRFPRIWLERMVLQNIDQAICVSEYVRETIAPLTQGNLYVVENPVSSRYFQAENREVQSRILFAGTIIRRKNILDLLKAINILRNKIFVDLHIVGVAEERYYYKILREYVREKKLEKNVTFLGTLSDEELLHEYEECCIVVLPSFEESAGMVLQQAMAAGKPVLATRTSGIPCIVMDKVTGWLTELGKVQELANKIRTLLENQGLRMSMGQAGKNEAVRRFRPEVIASKTYDVYRMVLGSR